MLLTAYIGGRCFWQFTAECQNYTPSAAQHANSLVIILLLLLLLTFSACAERREADQFEAMKVNWSLTERETFCNGTLSVGCYTPHYVGDVFFFSCLIFLGTFILSFYLKLFRNTRFFPNKVSWLPSFFLSLRISVFLFLPYERSYVFCFL